MVKNGLYFGVVYRVIQLVACKAINLINCVEKLRKICPVKCIVNKDREKLTVKMV
jgi:hypothetical protein